MWDRGLVRQEQKRICAIELLFKSNNAGQCKMRSGKIRSRVPYIQRYHETKTCQVRPSWGILRTVSLFDSPERRWKLCVIPGTVFRSHRWTEDCASMPVPDLPHMKPSCSSVSVTSDLA